MITLVAGLTLWAVVHWFPVAMPVGRGALVSRLGELPYKGLFSVLSFVAIGLIVLGWQRAPLVKVYVPPMLGNWLIGAAIAVSVVLFLAPYIPNNLRRVVRHPQLTGVVVWAAAHLLVNGTSRDVLLFGGFAVWAAGSMWFANRRDGAWSRPPAVAIWKDGLLVVAGLAGTALLFHFHAQLFGVTPIYLSGRGL